MKQISFLLALCSIFAQNLFAQTLAFNRTYGGPAYDDARSIVPTNDGCFVFTGLSKNAPDSLGDMYLTKINAAGAVMWTKYYGRPQEDGGNNIIRTSDGGFLLVGHTAFTYGISCDGYLVKTDGDGNMLWYALVGTAYDDVCDAAIELEDGSFLVTGRVENTTTRTFRVLLAKISPDGEQIFMKELPTNLPSLGFKIAQATDGNFLIAGYSYRVDESNSDMLLLKCTPDGTVLWQQNFGTELNDRAYSLVSMPDGGCVVVGGSADATEQSVQMLAYQFDANGTVTASNINLAGSGRGYLYDIVRTSEGQFAVAGILHQPADSDAKAVVGILDNELNVSEWRSVDFPVECRSRGLAEDKDGNFILCGNTYPEDGEPDIFIAKIPAATGALAKKDFSNEPFLLFPNPFRDFTYLKIGAPFQTKTLTISSLDGKEIRQTIFESSELFIYREGLPSGNYVFTVRDKEGKLFASGKLAAE